MYQARSNTGCKAFDFYFFKGSGYFYVTVKKISLAIFTVRKKNFCKSLLHDRKKISVGYFHVTVKSLSEAIF